MYDVQGQLHNTEMKTYRQRGCEALGFKLPLALTAEVRWKLLTLALTDQKAVIH